MSSSPFDITQLLAQASVLPEAADQLIPLVYKELRKIASHHLRGERAGHTLQTTALVHEAYFKVLKGEEVPWSSRREFFRAAAAAMRRILIDHARKRKSLKRGGDNRSMPLNAMELATEHDPHRLLALDEALKQLETEDSRAAEVVHFRFYAGLSVSETAAALDTSERTVHREWSFAKARLFALLSEKET